MLPQRNFSDVSQGSSWSGQFKSAREDKVDAVGLLNKYTSVSLSARERRGRIALVRVSRNIWICHLLQTSQPESPPSPSRLMKSTQTSVPSLTPDSLSPKVIRTESNRSPGDISRGVSKQFKSQCEKEHIISRLQRAGLSVSFSARDLPVSFSLSSEPLLVALF